MISTLILILKCSFRPIYLFSICFFGNVFPRCIGLRRNPPDLEIFQNVLMVGIEVTVRKIVLFPSGIALL